MTPDPNRKSLRQFQCRDYLWESFEQMSTELDCSMEYLLNEALRQYARSRDRGGPLADMPEQPDSRAQQPAYRGPGGPGPLGAQGPVPGRGPTPGMPPPMRPQGAPGTANPFASPVVNAPQIGGPRPGLPPLQGGPGGPQGPSRLPSLGGGMPGVGLSPQPMQQPGLPPQGMPSMQRPGAPNLPPMLNPADRARPGTAMGMGPNVGPAPLPGRLPGPPAMSPPPQYAAPRPMAAPVRGNNLIAVFEGQSYPVNKEEFVIGRGQKTSDLTIRDSNVSRRHACVVLYNGQYWIVDQQSTNGVEINGTKVDRKVIEDGDLFRICDHEIRFMYR